jgi:hypothetical protein
MVKMKVYVTLMRRWGGEEAHHYIEGVYTTHELAMRHGIANRNYRGGKYEPHIVEMEMESEDFTEIPDYYAGKEWARQYK